MQPPSGKRSARKPRAGSLTLQIAVAIVLAIIAA